MALKELQQKVDDWINEYGVRYFDVKTNALILSEEVGEFNKLIARKYGEQSFKTAEQKENAEESIKDELADILFVITCLANQMNIDLDQAVEKNFNKKTNRDHNRHSSNQKLKE